MVDARMDEFLVRWHAMIESGDSRALLDMLAEDVEFRSPLHPIEAAVLWLACCRL